MKHRRNKFRFLSALLLVALLLSVVPTSYTVYADSLRYYDYAKKSDISYTGKQVIYYYNNQKLGLTYPGIISDNGVALADYQELFVNELGLQAKLSGNNVTFTNGTTTVQLTIGSTNAVVNNKNKTMSVAPLKVKFADGVDRILVPSRFVAEAFGYTYVWTSSTSTVKITKTYHLSVGTSEISYNSSVYSLQVNDKKVALDMPVFYYQGAVLAPLKNVCEALGCQYTEHSEEYSISKGDVLIKFKLNEKAIDYNDKRYVMDIAPVLIKDNDTNNSKVYISLEFLADILGYELSYNDNLKQYSMKETSPEKATFLEIVWNTLPKTEKEPVITPITSYFNWIDTDNATDNAELKYISKITGYAIDKADILEVHGIKTEDVKTIVDDGFIIFEISDATSEISGDFFSDYANPYLQYVLFTQLSNRAKIRCMISENTQWTMLDKNDYVQIVFTQKDTDIEELLLSSLPVSEPVYPDDCIIIPLPADIDIEKIDDFDNYTKQQFQIMLSGNYVDYYEKEVILNPYYAVKECKTAYDKASNQTILTFTTSHTCAYKYEKNDGYLAVKVGRPNELYSKIVLLDAGHGGIDPGAALNGYKEKDLNFKIINTYVKELFYKSDIKVYFTRESDVKIDLYDRAALASEIGADIFISLHMNTNNNTSVNGTEVFYSASNNTKNQSGLNSATLAKALAQNISTALGSRNRGASDSNFVVVKYNTVPAVLIETGFMSSKQELAKLVDSNYQKKIAQAIFSTVEQIFKDYPTKR